VGARWHSKVDAAQGAPRRAAEARPLTHPPPHLPLTPPPPRHESDLKDNVYWLGLLTHLQVGTAGSAPPPLPPPRLPFGRPPGAASAPAPRPSPPPLPHPHPAPTPHPQSPGVPYKRVECLRDLCAMYEAATVDDIYEAYDCLAIGEAEVRGFRLGGQVRGAAPRLGAP
jgi:hypothetical protein